MRNLLIHLLLLAGSLLLSYRATAQSDGRVFTTTAVDLAFPVAALRTETQPGWGTSFTIEYRLKPSFALVGAWDSNKLPVQSANLLAKLAPALRGAVAELKGTYLTNALGLYGIRYFKSGRTRPYLTGGVGLNIITVPAPFYNEQTRLLSLESASKLTIYAMGGFGINWQFAKPVAFFGEANAYFVPASSAVASGSNSFLTLKTGLRFPLF